MIIHYRIIENFEKGYTIEQLSKKYNIAEKELDEKLKEYYSKKNNLKQYNTIIYKIKNDKTKTNIKKIIIDFEDGFGTRKLAQKYGTTRCAIDKVLKAHYLLFDMLDYYEEVKDKRKYKSEGKLKYILTKEMQKDFENGESTKSISKKYGIPYTSLRRLFIKEGLIGSVGGKDV